MGDAKADMHDAFFSRVTTSMIGPPPDEPPPPDQIPLPDADNGADDPTPRRSSGSQVSGRSRSSRRSDALSAIVGSGSMLSAHRNNATYAADGAGPRSGGDDSGSGGNSANTRSHSITFLNSRKRIHSPNARFRSGRNMRIKGKRARDLLRMSIASNTSVDLPPPDEPPPPKRQSGLSGIISAAMAAGTHSDEGEGVDEGEDDHPPPPADVPPPPAKHSSDGRRISRRRTSPEAMLTLDAAAAALQQQQKETARRKKRATLSSDLMGAMVVPNHPPPPGMPPPGMEVRGMGLQSWRLPSDFDVNAIPVTVTLIKQHALEKMAANAEKTGKEQREQTEGKDRCEGSKVAEDTGNETKETKKGAESPKVQELERLDESLARAQRGLDARETVLNHEWKRLREEKRLLQQQQQQQQQQQTSSYALQPRQERQKKDLSLMGLLELWHREQQETAPVNEESRVAQVRIMQPPGNLPQPPSSRSLIAPSPPPAAPQVVPALALAPVPTLAEEPPPHATMPTTRPALPLTPTKADILEQEGERAQRIHKQQMSEFNTLLHALNVVSGTAMPASATGRTHEEASLAALIPVPNSHLPVAREATGTSPTHRQVWQEHFKLNASTGSDMGWRGAAPRSSNSTISGGGGGGSSSGSSSSNSSSSSSRRRRRRKKAATSPQKGWIGTTRRNTLIGVDYGIGSGRLVPDRPPHAAIRRNLDALEQAKRNAMRELRRKKRAATAGHAQHDQRLRRASRVAQSHLEFRSQYGHR